MSRKTFFSFHYERDSMRAAQVREYNTISDQDEIGVIDAAKWEEIKGQGDQAIKNWIQEQLKSTSVTAVLIGSETASREWVRYEIVESWNRGNALLGIRIHDLEVPNNKTAGPGLSPFDGLVLEDGTPLSSCCKIYDWNGDNGRSKMGKWAEDAVQVRLTQSGHGKLPSFSPSSSKPVDRSAFVAPARPTIIQNPPGQWAS